MFKIIFEDSSGNDLETSHDSEQQQIISAIEEQERLEGREINIVKEQNVSRQVVHLDGQQADLVSQVIISFVSGGGAIATIKMIQTIIQQWLRNKASRKVSVKIGRINLSSEGDLDFEKIIQLAEKALSKENSSVKKEND